MREHLLGYLMGALDASQQKEVEQALETDWRLRRELELLNEALAPLRADRGLHEPPAGLADRTLDAVGAVAGWPEEDDDLEASSAEREAFLGGFFGNEEQATGVPPLESAAVEKPTPRRRKKLAPAPEFVGRSWADRWAVLDVIASAGVVAAAAMLFFPAIANSRFQSRVVACQSNLKTIGEGLESYSENHNGQLVSIPIDGPLSIGGLYAPTLRDDGYVPEESKFFCAADASARPAAEDARPRRIPTIAEIESALGPELRRLQRLAGGSYGYNLGYMIDGRYRPLRNLHRSSFAILADAPGPQRAGRQSLHHGAGGQNVLFEDGHIEFLAGSLAGGFDEIFFSDRNLVEAGQHVDDAVIGDSHSRPVLFTPVGGR